MISAVAADEAKAATQVSGKTCADAKAFVCAATDCCGTVTDADKAKVKANETGATKGIAATVCAKKPTDDEVTAKGAKFVVVKAAAAVTEPVDKVADAVDEVAGTFLCNAAAEATDAASYMTVGAAAIIAAATLLQ